MRDIPMREMVEESDMGRFGGGFSRPNRRRRKRRWELPRALNIVVGRGVEEIKLEVAKGEAK